MDQPTFYEFISGMDRTGSIDLIRDDNPSMKKDFKDCLLANLYSTVEFLKKELEEKNFIIRQLLQSNDTTTAHIEKTSVFTDKSNFSNSTTNDAYITLDNNTQNSDKDIVDSFENSSASPPIDDDSLNSYNLASQINDQLEDVRMQKHKEFLLLNNDPSNQILDSNNNSESNIKESNIVKPWPKNTLLIASDSMFNNIDENRLSKYMNVKVRAFSGATVIDMFNYITPLIKKRPDHILLHVGTNDAVNLSSDKIFTDLIDLISYIKNNLPNVNIILSTPTIRTDDVKANLTISRLCELIRKSDVSILDNSNIEGMHIGKKGLHLNGRGTGRIALNIINLIRKL